MHNPLAAILRLPLLVLTLVAALALGAQAAQAAPLDLANLSASEAESMLQAGTVTSVELTRAYLRRIDALNKRGPALNAVTQFDSTALQQAADSDALRAKGVNLGPAMGLPILLKDIVDAKGMYTSAGNWSLRNSFPAKDSGVTAYLRQHGVIILGKVGLSEFANYFGGQSSGFSNLTGQVLNANDTDETPSGSSSGTGAAVQASLSALGIGTETSGSIISPAREESLVGLRPTVGLVPGFGIAPIIASQDTAGPMERTVTDAAMTLQSITGTDPDIEAEAKQEYIDVFGSDYLATGVLPTRPDVIPNYMSALTTDFVQGKRVGYTFSPAPDCTVTQTTGNNISFCALKAAGATMVAVSQASTPAGTYRTTNPTTGVVTTSASYPGITSVEVKRTINGYYAHLGPDAPIKSMADELADNMANPILALKYGNASHYRDAQADISTTPLERWRSDISYNKAKLHANLDAVFNLGTADTADDVIAAIGSLSNTPQAGYPQTTVPMPYTATQRRASGIGVYGPAFSERDIIGVSYVLEQATKLHQSPQALNPSMYRCAETEVAAPFASRGGCNPDYDSASAAAGSTDTPSLGFKLEGVSIPTLQAKMDAGTLTSVALTKAYLNRIALTNAEGPGLQAVRALNPDALAQAQAADDARTAGASGSMLGIPVLLDDSYDVAGMPTTAGSIALQGNKPAVSSKVVSKLRSAGAVILGKTNVTEFSNFFDANITQGYSSLGGQVLDSYDTDKTPAGSSAGSASALSAGLAAATIGLQTSQSGLTTAGANDPTQFAASAILPASVMGVAALKPTVGRISRVGVLGVAKAQDSPTPMALTIKGLAAEMNTLAGIDASDTEVVASGAAPDYASGLSVSLSGRTVGVLPSSGTNVYTVANTPGYADAISAITAAGGTAPSKSISNTAASAPVTPPNVLPAEFKRDLNAYLATGHTGGPASLSAVIGNLVANPVEGLKFSSPLASGCGTFTGQLPSQLCSALSAADVAGGPSTDVTTGRTNYQTYLNTQLSGTDALLVPASNALVGFADKAGYPVLTLQSGYQFSGSTAAGYAPSHDPYGVALIGAANSEQTLLNIAYAMEQKLATTSQSVPASTTGTLDYPDGHVAPSVYNPAMFRCVPGSVYYAPYNCHPGDRSYVSPIKEPVTVGSSTGAGSTGSTGDAPATSSPALGSLGKFVDAVQKIQLGKKLKNKVRASTRRIRIHDTFVEKGFVKYSLYLSVFKAKKGGKGFFHKALLPATTTRKITGAGPQSISLWLSRNDRSLLQKYPESKLFLVTRFFSGLTTDKLMTIRRVSRAG
ncbi:MAG: Asp-tRNAAsn/Glu-tRNAGln amidotransferase subunit [Solirubrobacterales bacterium]|nr:Asp-tRNAAsn/Glu-tRNAGln amidotransferase subunit [Solirubrobacterales bacterium]